MARDGRGSLSSVSVAVAGSLLLAACTGTSAGTTSGPSRSGSASTIESVGASRFAPDQRQPSPDLGGTTLTGSHFALHDVTGNVVVVNIWASWCGPCRVESPILAAASAHLAGQPVRFVGVDESDTSAEATRFIASAGVTYPQLFDPNGVLLRQLTLLPQKGIPSTLILDRRGRMAARVIGPITAAELQTLVDELLQEH